MSVKTVTPTTCSPADPVLRLESIVDSGSLTLATADRERGVVAGRGAVDGQDVELFACDPRTGGGALSEAGSEVIVRSVEEALRQGVPVVGVWHSGGARLQEGPTSLHGMGRVFRAIVRASGRIPQVSVVLGPAAGGAAYGPALTDFVVTGPDARIFVTGAEVVHMVTGEDVDAVTLGGPEQHASRSGVVHLPEASEEAALSAARRLLMLMKSRPPDAGLVAPDPWLGRLVPASPRQPYDVRIVVQRMLDGDAPSLELHPLWARNVVTVLGRLGGATVGVVANNPMYLCGCLDSTGSEKAGRFVRTCDALGVPLVVLADVPGYLPGRAEEWEGIVRRGAKLLHAFAEAVVPRVTVILRKAYGGAFIAMNSKSLGATAVYAWPTAEVGVMYSANAAAVLHRRLLEAAPVQRRAQLLSDLAAEYERGVGGISRAVERGYVDEIIEPAQTPRIVARALAEAAVSRGGHSNIPI